MMISSQTTQIQLITVVPILSILDRHYYDLFTSFYLDLHSMKTSPFFVCCIIVKFLNLQNQMLQSFPLFVQI